MDSLTRYLAVAVGGAFGAMLRFYLGGSVLARAGAPFPTATFVINISGSFIIGFFLTLVTERFPIGPHLRLAVAVGFIGAYTTFSTFEYETARLVEERDFTRAFLNVALSFIVGFLAVWGGIIAARMLEGVPPTSHAAYDRFEEQANMDDRAQLRGAERDIRDSTIEAHTAWKSKTGERQANGDS
ncbi:MAG TPA: fluoride efflux transporter CrcB [Pyrinomonadaceae bacterium]|jgi:CrcB protein|nr:fluoride efflux transporter CrcB [Pyrinomonadaceae bacterium]